MFIARSRQFQLLSLSLLAAADFTSAPVAHASCVKRTAAQYVKDADLVFIGRAGPLKIRGKESTQGIRVLHRIKGKPGKVFTRVRPAGMPIPNDRVYAEGEVALFFVRKGNIDLCAGNFQLAAQMPFIGEVLGHGPGEERKPGRTIIPRVIEELVAPYFHHRVRIPVTYPPLAGKRLTLGRRTLFFVKERRKDAVEIRRALGRGRVFLVQGVYHLEGLSFRALLLTGKDGIEVLFKESREREGS